MHLLPVWPENILWKGCWALWGKPTSQLQEYTTWSKCQIHQDSWQYTQKEKLYCRIHQCVRLKCRCTHLQMHTKHVSVFASKSFHNSDVCIKINIKTDIRTWEVLWDIAHIFLSCSTDGFVFWRWNPKSFNLCETPQCLKNGTFNSGFPVFHLYLLPTPGKGKHRIGRAVSLAFDHYI